MCSYNMMPPFPIYQRIEQEEKRNVKCRGRARATARTVIHSYKSIFVLPREELAPLRDSDKVVCVGRGSSEVSARDSVRALAAECASEEARHGAARCRMTKKTRCRICDLLGENQELRHSCHSTSHLRSGLSYGSFPNMNYVNHGLLNGLYLPQLKDMMLAAYLLRGKDHHRDINMIYMYDIPRYI